MRKITLLLVAFISVFTLKMEAQDLNISFESSNNYTIGELNGQNDWSLNNATASPLIVITDEESSDGTQSLKFSGDPNGPLPDNGLAAAFYSPSSAFDSDVVTYTVDLWIESGDGTNNTEFGIINQSPSQEFLTSRVVFLEGDLFVLNTSPTDPTQLEFQNVGTYSEDEWIEFKAVYDFGNEIIEYYIDDNLLLTGDVFAGTNIEQMIFLSSLNQTAVYIDNVNFTSETMSINQVSDINFSVYPNPTTDIINITSSNSTNIKSVNIFNINGKEVNASLNEDNSVDVNHLSTGTYLMNVETNEGSNTVKFIKK